MSFDVPSCPMICNGRSTAGAILPEIVQKSVFTVLLNNLYNSKSWKLFILVKIDQEMPRSFETRKLVKTWNYMGLSGTSWL
jgi:hypothetical protein